MSNKLISVDFYSLFGFLKKPDINEDIYLTYNCLHKPALLGILGAIIGLKGYYQAFEKNKNELPEYLNELDAIKVGIKPIKSNNGNFQKTVIKYNNSVGYANKMEDNKSGETLNITEQTLIKPSYRIYLLLNTGKPNEEKLYNNLVNNESEFIPYLGKNDFQLWWSKPKEYSFREFDYNSDFNISSLFIKDKAIKKVRDKIKGKAKNFFSERVSFFSYFERLPIGFSEKTKNYELEEFIFTNLKFPSDYTVNSLYELTDNNNNTIVIQLF